MKSEDLLPLHGAFQTFFSFHLCHFLSLALSSCVIALYLHEALVCLGRVTDKNNHKYSTDLYIGKQTIWKNFNTILFIDSVINIIKAYARVRKFLVFN